MWRLLEPLHALTYFDPASIDALAASGLRGFWMGYFAARAAPMGPVAAPMVESTFYNFAPRLVRRAIPDAWSFASPASVLDARWSGAARALAPHVAALAKGALTAAGGLLAEAVASLACEGRPLAAANAALAAPDDALAALWQLTTTLREHRGDGHVAALVCAGLGGLEAHLTLVATGVVDRDVLQRARGFTDEEWDEAANSLEARGLLRADGALTEAGDEVRRTVEDATDRAASGPWSHLGEAGCEELHALLHGVTASIEASGTVPPRNPIGLPRD
jgi:hypothetical protein